MRKTMMLNNQTKDCDRTQTFSPQIEDLVPYPLGHTVHANIALPQYS